MSAAAKLDVRGLVAELRAQGWTVALRADGQTFRCEPPMPGKQSVVFASSARQFDFVQVSRTLREQGFVWPRQQTSPFSAKPNPHAAVETRAELVIAPSHEKVSADVDLSLLVSRLLEAKATEERLADQERVLRKEADEKAEIADMARREWEDAVLALGKAKDDFDRAFAASRQEEK